MYKIIDAVYKDGHLILEQRLDKENENRRLKILILEKNEIESRKQDFFHFIAQHSIKLPENYQFDREEIHER